VLQRARVNLVQPNGQLRRCMPDGSTRQVPHPDTRLSLVKEMHETCGRTRSLLQNSFWWAGMAKDVERATRSCPTCYHANATFNHHHPAMQPVPVRGMFYTWNVDLAGPLPTSASGHGYVMVCIESLSKHVECIPLSNKEASSTATSFLTHVIGRFGACAEVLTEQETEFQGAFYAMLTSCLIDHRLTSPNHPQAN